MTVDDYSSGLNVRLHQNKLGTAISDSRTGGPRRRQWSTPRRFIFGRPSPLAILQELYRLSTVIRCSSYAKRRSRPNRPTIEVARLSRPPRLQIRVYFHCFSLFVCGESANATPPPLDLPLGTHPPSPLPGGIFVARLAASAGRRLGGAQMSSGVSGSAIN